MGVPGCPWVSVDVHGQATGCCRGVLPRWGGSKWPPLLPAPCNALSCRQLQHGLASPHEA